MKDNKLIAEFMEVVFHDDENQYYNADGLHIGNTLQYDTSWDWLMPVVEKIKSTQFRDRDLFSWGYRMYKESTSTCVFEFYQDGYRAKEVIKAVDFDCMKKATYKAVVEFIKQHNKES